MKPSAASRCVCAGIGFSSFMPAAARAR
jgi:hypothetical protein